MTITYECKKGLYVNMTNKCTNNCDFCVRSLGDGIYGSDCLWLEREPTKEEVWEDIQKHDLSAYEELVFCGYGEPTCRLYDMLWLCRNIRKASDIPIRVNTNGQADLITGENTAPVFEGLVDVVSISLNASNSEDYQKVCHCVYGEDAFYALIRFAGNVKKYVKRVLFTVVRTTISEEEISKCMEIADSVGVELVIREIIT